MIRYKVIDGLTCPFFMCTVCGKEITHGPMAMIAWDMKKEPDAELFAVHKGDCMHRLERRIETVDGGMLGTNEIGFFVACLMDNTGYDMGPAATYSGIGTQFETSDGGHRRPFTPKKKD